MDLSIAQLRVFVAVAERGNFTRAAEFLYMTQPSVSEAIAKLEQRAGQRLFEHLGKRIYLTQAGETMLHYAKRIVALAEEADGALAECKEVGTGRLLMGASNTIGIYVLPSVLRGFRPLYPKASISIEIGNTTQVAAGLLENRLDFGLVAGHPEHPDLDTRHFLRDKLVLIVPAGHPSASKGTMPVAELAKERFIIRERGATTRNIVERELNRLGIAPAVAMELGDNEAIKQSVAAGLGVSVVSELSIAPELALGSIARVELEGAEFRRDFYLVLHKGKYQTRTVREFLSYLISAVSAMATGSPSE